MVVREMVAFGEWSHFSFSQDWSFENGRSEISCPEIGCSEMVFSTRNSTPFEVALQLGITTFVRIVTLVPHGLRQVPRMIAAHHQVPLVVLLLCGR
jgi:hypothetical protein